MCWNEHVSLNTFLFSFFVLCLIIYNNAYTPYKIKNCQTIPCYLFIASFISMQLIEFFIWRNLNNEYNHVFTMMALLLIIIQPLVSLFMLPNTSLRRLLMILYSAFAIPYVLYDLRNPVKSIVSKNGHLRWLFFKNNVISTWTNFIFWLFFFLFAFVYQGKWEYVGFILITVGISIFYHTKDKTFTSMWCWISNTLMFFIAMYLLFWLPYTEHGLC